MTRVRLFFGYLKLVLKSWWFYAGITMGLMRLFEKWTGIPVPIPHRIMLAGAILGLCAAQWDAYKSSWIGRNKRVEELSRLAGEGMRIRRNYPNSAVKYLDRNSESAWIKDWNDWLEKTQAFLSRGMAPQAMTKFMHDTGLEEGFTIGQSPPSYFSLFDRQIQNLIDIIDHPNSYL